MNAYVLRLARAAKSGDWPIKPGEFYTAVIRHDGWCPVLKGESVCACKAEIIVTNQTTGEVFKIGETGEIIRRKDN